MSLYSLDDKTDLNAPVLVAAFDGWVDAGQAGTLAAEQLALGGTVVANFDGDQIYDYRARRPTLDIIDGTLMSLDWPELQLRTTSIGGRDLLILSGPEPDYRWRELSKDVAGLAKRLGVTSWVSLGAIPAAVAHTRPVPVLGTASVNGLLPDGVAQGPDGRLRVPSAAISVMELAASSAGVPSLGFYAQVPHYISAAYPSAAIELLKHVGRYLALELPLGELPAKALATRSLLDSATANDEQTKAYVERLEEMTDEAKQPTGDELIADIERYLREGGRGRNGGLPN
jgi:proteasome assembly chaperone (PAC2) family protein